MKISNLRDKFKIIANFKGEKNVTLSMIYAKVREYYTIILLCIHFFFFFLGMRENVMASNIFFVLGSLFSYTIRHFDIMQILKEKKKNVFSKYVFQIAIHIEKCIPF